MQSDGETLLNTGHNLLAVILACCEITPQLVHFSGVVVCIVGSG